MNGQALQLPRRWGPQQYRGQVLSAAVLHRVGIELCQAVSGKMTRADRDQVEQATEDGYGLRDHGLLELCRYALESRGLVVPEGAQNIVRMALTLADIEVGLTEAVKSIMTRSYAEAGDSTEGWVVERLAVDYKTMHSVNIQASDLEPAPAGGHAGNAVIDGTSESYKIAKYAKVFEIDEQDIINDRLDMITNVPKVMGQAAARLKPNLVYSILLANPSLAADGVALFHANHGNLAAGGGSALSASSLAAALVALANQTVGELVEKDTNLNLKGRFLIVPPDLRVTALGLLHAMEISGSEGERIELRSDARLGTATVKDPKNGTRYAGTATNWLMAAPADQAAAIEVAYLSAQGRAPRISLVPQRGGCYGLTFAVDLSIGAKALDFRGIYKGAGA